jgi:alkylation response protein AidB-like acyl-CoA dehydrogenase
MVPDGSAADLLVILEGTRLFIVDCAASGVSQVALRALDPTRKFARITLDAAPARELPGDVARLRDCAATLVAAEQLGGLTRCVQIATSYAKVREQFGKPIGAFQAVKHSLADLYALQELAESTVRYAAWAADAAPAELALAAAVTKAHLSDAYSRTAADTVHLLGGIGFTWEHDAHLYYKRARITALLHGDATVHRDRVARLLGAAG